MKTTKLISILIIGTLIVATNVAIAESDFGIHEREITFDNLSNPFDNLKDREISSMFDLIDMSLSTYNINQDVSAGSSNILQLNMLNNLNLFDNIDTGLGNLDAEDIEDYMQQFNYDAFVLNNIKSRMLEQYQQSEPADDMSEESEANIVQASNEIIIKFKDGVDFDDLSNNIDYLQNSIMPNALSTDFVESSSYDELKVEKLLTNQKSGSPNIHKVILPEYIDSSSFVSECREDQYLADLVVYVEPNYCYELQKTNSNDSEDFPNDPNFIDQWSLHQTSDHDIDAPEAWAVETGNSNIVIAVIDTGVRYSSDYTHDDLSENIWKNPGEIADDRIDNDGNGYVDDVAGWDFVNNDNNPQDSYNYHGTNCASIIGAVGNNSELIAGVCWNCSIMPVRCFYWDVSYADEIAEGIIYAVDNGADVISMSWGSTADSQLIRDAIEYAYSKGVVLVAAAGNYDYNLKTYPAAYPGVIGVAATDKNDEKAGFSNWGSWVDVAAPGVDIACIRSYGYLSFMSGTSAACPHVAGLAGLILSINDSLTPEMVRTIIKSGVESISLSGSDNFPYIGVGRINANNSLHKISDMIVNLDDALDDAIVSGILNIDGTASGSDFDSYSLYYGQGTYPDSWTLITTSTSPIENAKLGELNTADLEEGLYTIKLSVSDTSGRFYSDASVITVHNEVNTWHVGGIGPDNLTSISEAVCSSGDEDSVIVHPGHYNESVIVDRAVEIIGECKETVIVYGAHSGHVFYVKANNVAISNLTIYKSKHDGIICTSADYVNINNNIIQSAEGVLLLDSKFASITNNTFCDRNHLGVISIPFSMEFLLDVLDYELKFIEMIDSIGHYAGNATITNNLFLSDQVGIFMIMTDGHTIENNVFNLESDGNSTYFMGDASILLVSSSNNNLIENTMTCGGLFIFDSDDNVVVDNSVNGKPLVYLVEESSQTIDNAGQVILIDCLDITIENNNFSNVVVGVNLIGTDDCVIKSNIVHNVLSGIFMISSKNNEISYNTISESVSPIASLYGGNIIDNNTIDRCIYGISILGIETFDFDKLSNEEFELNVVADENPNTITNNEIINVSFGIAVISNGENIINNNTIECIYHYGFGIIVISVDSVYVHYDLNGEFQFEIFGGTKSNVVKNNAISDFESGIIIISDGDNLIEGNIITNVYLLGIGSISIHSITFGVRVDIDNLGYYVEYTEVLWGIHPNTIIDNNIQGPVPSPGCGDPGIMVISNAPNIISNNEMNNTDGIGIIDIALDSIYFYFEYAENGELAGNVTATIIASEQAQEISGNLIENTGIGISVISDGMHTVSDNVLSEVYMGISSVSFESAFIHAEGSIAGGYDDNNFNIMSSIFGGGNTNTFEDNQMYNVPILGIGVISDTTNTITGNIIQNDPGFNQGCTGIAVASLESVSVDSEYEYDYDYNSTEGYSESHYNYTGVLTAIGGQNDNTIENNIIQNTIGGIIVCSDASNTISGNTLEDTSEFGVIIISINSVIIDHTDVYYSYYYEEPYYSEVYHKAEVLTSIIGGENNNLVDNNHVNDSVFGLIVLSNSQNNILENQVSNVRSVGIASASVGSVEINQSYLYHSQGESQYTRENSETVSVNGGEKNCLIKENDVLNVGVLTGNLSSAIAVSSDANAVVEQNTIQNLTVSDNSFGCQSNGIFLLPASVEIRPHEINEEITEIVISDSSAGYNIVRHNYINGCGKGHGITLWNSKDNLIYGNDIENNTIGVCIPEDPFSEFESPGTQFISTFNSDDNEIYHNSFVNNNQQAFDECDNTWDDGYPSGGNYWDDYSGVDEDPEDGIGDTSYDIAGGLNQDRYPLMQPYGGNNKPVAVDDPAITDENVAVTINVLENDYDIDGDIILLDSYDSTSVEGGSITLDDNDTTTTSDDKLVYMPPLGYSSPPNDSFDYVISDGNGETDSATVYITINNVQDSPVSQKPVGETDGDLGVDYEYKFNATDSDDDLIYYLIDWGDGNDSGWIGPHAEGTEITMTYNWSIYGTYDVKLKAKDEHDLESDWSEALTVKILEDVSEVELTIKKGLSFKKVFATLENTGDIAVSDVNLNLTIDYGFFKIETIGDNMTIDTFEPGDLETISVKGPSGIKIIVITATAESPDFETITKEAKGLAIFNLILV